MTKQETWSTIAIEREALAADLAGLDDAQWATPSLCEGWTVEQTLGHMTATARMTSAGFFVAFLKAGFRFDRLTETDIARETEGGPAATLRRFKDLISSRNHPPGPLPSWLGETIIHGEDIRRPLGIAHDHPVEAVVQVADFYKGSNLIVGAKRRIAGVTLVATDADWRTGAGPTVEGPVLALVQAMTGRKVALDDLKGDGVDLLRRRD